MADENGTQGGRIYINGELLGESVPRSKGGGPKFHPQTFEEAVSLLLPQVEGVRDQVVSLDPRLRAEKVVVEAEVWANYLANSYFPSRLLRHLKVAPLGSKLTDGQRNLPSSGLTESQSKSYLLAVDGTDLDDLLDLMRTGGSSKALKGAADELRQFNGIRLSTARTAQANDPEAQELSPYEAVLHPDPDQTTVDNRVPASPEVLAKFAFLVESVGGRVHQSENDVVDGLTFVAVDLPAEQTEYVAAFNPLRSITPSPKIEVYTASLQEEVVEVVTPSASHNSTVLPEVLIFDGGVDASTKLFRDSVTYIDLTQKGLNHGDPAHGSAVTAAVLYGDLGQGGPLMRPAAQIRHYQIVPGPSEDASEYPWILRQIREQVLASKAPIVNLSLGPRAVVEDGEPHRWTAVLDKLAYEHPVLFVTAAGNNGHRDMASGLHRIQVPGDMVNGLCVGASDSPSGESPWRAAPYSARGPGRAGARIQPAVVAYGGTDERPFGRVRANGEIHFDDRGTSYAAPLVTNTLARVAREFGALSDAPTLRALAAHFAESPIDKDIHATGHGRLRGDVDELLTCGGDEATVVYQGLIARDEVLAYSLPYPESLNTGTFDLSWTVAFTSATDSAEAGDYTNAGLEATFRPHSSRYSFGRKDPVSGKHVTKVQHLQKDRHAIGRMLSQGWKQSPHPASRSPKEDKRNEHDRREQGKWETLWRAEDSIRASSLQKPRIDISHVTREGGQITNDTEDIEFSLVVTIRSKKGLPVYSEVASEFQVLTPLPSVIGVDVMGSTEIGL